MLSEAKHPGAHRARPFAEFTLSVSEWAQGDKNVYFCKWRNPL
jgi:hypothetical protein